MRLVNFNVDNGELRFIGTAKYTVSKAWPGDDMTPAEPAGIEDVVIVGIEAVHERRDIIWWDITRIMHHADMVYSLLQSPDCMEQVEEACRRDFEKEVMP